MVNFILDGLDTDLSLTTKPTFPTSVSSTEITGHLFTLILYNLKLQKILVQLF